MRKILHITLLSGVLLTASACSGKLGEVVGLGNTLPDEFAVVKRKPLTIPPDFALRPPSDAERTSKIALTDTRDDARRALLQEDALPSGTSGISQNTLAPAMDSNDQLFLAKAEAHKALPDIRNVVDQESSSLIREKRTFVKQILNLFIEEDPPGKIIEPFEANRDVNTQILVDQTEEASLDSSLNPTDDVIQQTSQQNGAKIIRKDSSGGFDFGQLWAF